MKQNNELRVENFFDISSFPFNDIFDTIQGPWEVLPKMASYIEQCFNSGIVKPNYKDREDVFLGEGTVIQTGVEIAGPLITGKNCFLGHASFFRDGCILGNNVHIGHAVEIKHSLFLNNAAAAHLNYVGDSVIGNHANLSGGSITANFRLDRKPVHIKIGDKKVPTGLEKFGSVIGDNTIIGVNAVMNPGTILGKNTIVYPLVSVNGVHSANETIK